MVYSLYGYEKLYTKDTNWVHIDSFPTKEEAENALSLRYSSVSGRNIGGFKGYKIVEEANDMPQVW